MLIICEGMEIKMPFVYLKFEVSNSYSSGNVK